MSEIISAVEKAVRTSEYWLSQLDGVILRGEGDEVLNIIWAIQADAIRACAEQARQFGDVA